MLWGTHSFLLLLIAVPEQGKIRVLPVPLVVDLEARDVVGVCRRVAKRGPHSGLHDCPQVRLCAGLGVRHLVFIPVVAQDEPLVQLQTRQGSISRPTAKIQHEGITVDETRKLFDNLTHVLLVGVHLMPGLITQAIGCRNLWVFSKHCARQSGHSGVHEAKWMPFVPREHTVVVALVAHEPVVTVGDGVDFFFFLLAVMKYCFDLICCFLLTTIRASFSVIQPAPVMAEFHSATCWADPQPSIATHCWAATCHVPVATVCIWLALRFGSRALSFC